VANRSDDFNRANGTLNGSTPSDGGSTWTASNANIDTNQVWPVSASGTRDTAWVETSSAVGSVQMKITTNGNSSGVVMRLSNATNHIVAYVSGNSLANYKRVSGSYTQIGSTYSGTIANGDVIRLDIDSSNAIRSYVNGTLRVGPNTDSTGSTNTKAGFEWLSNLTTVRIDDWSYTDNAGAAATSSPPVRAFPRAILNF
jgi:hypothetical protein